MRKKRLKLGDIYEIPLPNGKKAYGRLFKEYTLAIYRGFYNDISELSDTEEYYRFICVYADLLRDGEWLVVGHKSFQNIDDAWAPPKCVVDKITGKGSIYYKGEIHPCSYDECKDLEIATVWDRHHVIDMLMGNSKWDEVTSKPKPNI